MTPSRLFLSVLLVGISLTAVGCTREDRQTLMDKGSNFTTQDPELKYNRDDYRRMMKGHEAKKGDSLDNIPDLAPVIAEDKKNILPQPLVSITVNQDVPIRDIFYELAKQAEVDLELDPTITGSIIFTAYNRPFDQVVERITDMAGLRYTFKNNVLRIERDTPYTKTYNVSYLSVSRDYSSSINSSTSSATAASGGGGGGGGSNGSASSISSKSTTDFWNELESNINQIINASNQQVSLTDQSAPISAPTAIPAVSPQQLAAVSDPAAAGAALPSATQNAANVAAAAAPAPVAAPAAAAPAGPAIAGLLNPTGTQNAAGGGAAAAGAAPGGGTGAGTAAANPYFSINRQAGMINVFASEKQHRKIQSYIRDMMNSINTQVLIEAKVFEVELNDENSLGIDWAIIGSKGNFGVTLNRMNFSNPVTSPGGVFEFTSGDLEGLISAVARFGTVRALASPRLSVMNNQTAVLNVSESRVFFTIEIERTEGTANNPPRTDITSEINNVPEGLIITVHPSVDPDTNEITMNLRPSITRVVRTVTDPGLALAAQANGFDNAIENLIPELSVREIDSIVRMSSGKTILMGGLMQDRAEGIQQSIPLLGEIPLIGNLFRVQRDTNRKTEMVIMLRATVVGNNPKMDDTDKNMYDKMGNDRHPFSVQ